MWEVEVAEDTFMQGLSVRARARQPGGDGRLSGAEDAFGRRWVQPFGQCSQHHGDVIGRGFQPVQGRIASSTEGGVTGLTPKGLNLLGTAMLAIPNQRVDVSLGDPEVQALRVGTGEALSVYAFGSTSPTFPFTPGTHRHRHYSRRGRRGQTTGRAIIWAARLEQTGERAALGPVL